MSFTNETRFAAFPAPLVDAAGYDVLVVIVKATFVVDDHGRASVAEQRPIRLHDVLRDEGSPASSALFPSDLGLPKRGSDVVVVGDAVSERRVTVMDVGVSVRGETVPLRVHGTRVFYRGAIGVGIGPAQPFTRMPIAYELTYGGTSADCVLVETRNPVGVGVAAHAGDLVGQRAPQIEHPARPHVSATDRHPPVGFGAIMTNWSPRLEYVGTLDHAWQTERMPALPLDHDERFANVAHPTLQFSPGLAPGDSLAVVGMSLEPFVTSLPGLGVEVRGRFDTGERVALRPAIDTVIVEPEAGVLEIAGRAALRLGRGKRVLREVVVREVVASEVTPRDVTREVGARHAAV
jgi:hypothetical protein